MMTEHEAWLVIAELLSPTGTHGWPKVPDDGMGFEIQALERYKLISAETYRCMMGKWNSHPEEKEWPWWWKPDYTTEFSAKRAALCRQFAEECK